MTLGRLCKYDFRKTLYGWVTPSEVLLVVEELGAAHRGMLVAHFVEGHGEDTWSTEKHAHASAEINQSHVSVKSSIINNKPRAY